MRIGETLKKAAGLFVDIPEDTSMPDLSSITARPAVEPRPAPKTVEQVVREQPGPNLDQIQAPADPAQPVIDSTGSVRFGEIYRLASLPSSAFTAEQVLELLGSLPADLPLSSKRATVKITVDAMAKTTGVTTEAIVADASRKLAALAAYAKSYTQQADEYANKSELEIISLEQQIAARKSSIEEARHKKEQMVAACTTESDRLDDVLEFFTMDVGASKNAVP